MRNLFVVVTLILCVQANLCGCALGRKDWPSPQKGEDRFSLKLMDGIRQDECIMMNIAVKGASDNLWRATVQYEAVGTDEGQGCAGCPFVPRDVIHFTRESSGFVMQNNVLRLNLCGLNPGVEYRFRVVGKSELPSMPLENTDVYVAAP